MTQLGFAVFDRCPRPRRRRIGWEKVIIFYCLAFSLNIAVAFQSRMILSQRPEIRQQLQQYDRRKSSSRTQFCNSVMTLMQVNFIERYQRGNSFQFHRYRHASKTLSTTMIPMSLSMNESKRKTRATSVYALILINLAIFVVDKVLRNPFVKRNFYLYHSRWHWWQPLTACFCHVDRNHLSNNLFLLLLFGRSVEDDQGWGGLLFSFAFCGILSSLVSLFMLPRYTVSIGASGAVFGLFAVSTLGKLSWSDLNWRKLVETAVLGEFVFRQIVSEAATAASGGTAGINHVAHLSGAAAGAILVFGMRSIVGRFERQELKN